jgi:membrane-bound lytic murein transglycosylase A
MSFIRTSLLASVLLALAACSTAPMKPPAVVPPPTVTTLPPTVQPPGTQATTPAPPPAPLFTPTSFAALPNWANDDLRQAWPAFISSCNILVKQATWSAACTAAKQIDASNDSAIRQYFEANFTPNLVRAADGADTGLITGYYEPLLHGSRTRGGVFQTPLYKVPDDLITIDLASVYPELKGMRLRGRLVGKKVVPYNSRAEIERADAAAAANGKNNANHMLWVDDAVEAFFLEVQGSGRVQLDDGRETVRVAYADQNGHPYKSIGRWLVEKGELTLAQASAQGIKAWIIANPTRQQELFNANPSFVFFKEERLPDPSVGPKGAQGVPLTPGRSVAIDAQFLPLGAPIYLSTTEANSEVPLQRLVMGQDTGGAIRGAIRADFFYGFGKEAAESAGRMKQRGTIWVLLPKTVPAN